jgi:hypothetical protein
MLGLLLAVLMIGIGADAQTLRSTDDPRNQAPTVNGGTGLFTVYDAQTLRKGEFNFGFYANHFHRDPGNIRFQVYPVNFQVGFNDYVEFFANFESQKNLTVGAPALLSGFYMPDVRTKTLAPGRLVVVPGQNSASVLQSDPCGNGGFPGPCRIPGGLNIGPFTARPTGNNTALYVGLGAPVGGILPALAPNVNPSYNPAAPFISRFNGSGMGDIWLGAKIRLTSPKSSVGFALIPVVKVPITRDLFPGLENGRSTGSWDYGMIVAFDGRLNKYINLSSNVGFIRKGDPQARFRALAGARRRSICRTSFARESESTSRSASICSSSPRSPRRPSSVRGRPRFSTTARSTSSVARASSRRAGSRSAPPTSGI